MNTAELNDDWQKFLGKFRDKWGPLTYDEWKSLEGERDHLLRNIQKRHQVSPERAERKLAGLVRVLTLGVALGALPGSTRWLERKVGRMVGRRNGN
jgi:uncharacterized protein YjbJ (UPF0337 family)